MAKNEPKFEKMAIFWRIRFILHYIVLYCIVLYCIVLYCIVLYRKKEKRLAKKPRVNGTTQSNCIVLHCIVLYCIVLHYIVSYCIVLHCIVLYCIVDGEKRATNITIQNWKIGIFATGFLKKVLGNAVFYVEFSPESSTIQHRIRP